MNSTQIVSKKVSLIPPLKKQGQFFYIPGQRFWSLITRAKPAKVLEPPLFGSRRGGLHALLRRRPCS